MISSERSLAHKKESPNTRSLYMYISTHKIGEEHVRLKKKSNILLKNVCGELSRQVIVFMLSSKRNVVSSIVSLPQIFLQ